VAVTEIEITAMEPGVYGVEVREGNTTTGHRVRIPAALEERPGLRGADQEVVVRETFSFLLEREPATSILTEFGLDDVARFFPEFYDELRSRLAR
jgi:hypothetical protein